MPMPPRVNPSSVPSPEGRVPIHSGSRRHTRVIHSRPLVPNTRFDGSDGIRSRRLSPPSLIRPSTIHDGGLAAKSSCLQLTRRWGKYRRLLLMPAPWCFRGRNRPKYSNKTSSPRNLAGSRRMSPPYCHHLHQVVTGEENYLSQSSKWARWVPVRLVQHRPSRRSSSLSSGANLGIARVVFWLKK